MQKYVVKIKAYLEDCRRTGFTGGIKMAFEKGMPKTFWRSTCPEFHTNPIDNKFDLGKELETATVDSFNGSLMFLLENGIIKNFDSTETLQGRDLIDRLEKYHLSAPVRAALVIRKKAHSA
jgi:hypothetical protein